MRNKNGRNVYLYSRKYGINIIKHNTFPDNFRLFFSGARE
jgi:hypothetical protein